MTAETSTSSENSLFASHARLQSTIIKYFAPIMLTIVGVSTVYNTSWQKIVMLIGVMICSAIWMVALALTQRGKTLLSAKIFATSVITILFMTMLLFSSFTPIAILGDFLVIVYTSFFSRKFLFACSGAAFLSLAIGEALQRLNLYDRVHLTALDQIIIVPTFALI